MLVPSREVQAFIRACEHLLSRTSSPPLSDNEGVLVDYYIQDIQELSNKYGAPKEDGAHTVALHSTHTCRRPPGRPDRRHL